MFLLDTDTIIYSLKGNEKVIGNLKLYSDAPKAISVITYGELIFGARKSERIQENLAKVHRVKELFPVLEVTSAVIETFGELKAELQPKGITAADLDLIIGATALSLGYSVVTNNTKHFNKIPGVRIENWAE